MLELKLYQNNSSTSAQYGMWYPRVDYKEEYDVVKLAKHMAEHETPFSAGTIKGILMDAIKCIRHLCLEGKTVKIEDLAIFKCSVEGNATATLYDKNNDVTIRAAIGSKTAKDPKTGQVKPTGNAVKSIKLLAQATGEFTRAELNKVGTLNWTDKAASQIAAAKAAANSGGGD